MIDYIIEIDKDEDLYRKMLKEPWLPGNKLTRYLDINILTNQFRRIFG